MARHQNDIDHGPFVFYMKDRIRRAQGWKVHVSANVRNLEDVVRTCVPVLTQRGIPFKLVRDAGALLEMGESNAQAGKAVTVYPNCDEDAVGVAAAIHEKVAQFHSPRIASDRRLVRGSPVHYRFGAFKRRVKWDQKSRPTWYIIDPSGNEWPDPRSAVYRPPVWARDPFLTAGIADDGDVRSAIDGRFSISHARRGPRSLVMLGAEVSTGRRVAIKRSIRWSTERSGRFVSEGLQSEAQILRGLQASPYVPHLVATLSDDEADYNVTTRVEGPTLWSYVQTRMLEGDLLRTDEVERLAQFATEAVQSIHDSGVSINDIAPGNIIVGTQRVHMIDFEHSSRVDHGMPTEGTEGFSAGLPFPRRPLSIDWFSLASVVCFIASGVPLYVKSRGLSVEQRLSSVLGSVRPADAKQIQQIVSSLIDAGSR